MQETIRWGIIGTGDVAERKGGPALYQAARSSLVGVTNRTLDRAKDFSARHGNPRVHESVDSLLADDDIDAVYIATHPDTHADFTERAALAGKHVLCEKPMAMSVDQADRMINACKAKKVSLSVAFYRREFPAVKKAKDLFEAGAIGRPLSIHAQTYSAFASNEANPWRLDKSTSGGGFLMDVGSHRLDLFGHFFGKPKDVAGWDARQTLSQEVEDAAVVSLRFSNDVLGSASFHWNTPIDRDTLTIVGTDGLLTIDDLSNRGKVTLEREQGKEFWALPASAPVHLPLVERLIMHLLDGAPNPCSGEQGAIANQIISHFV